MLTPAQYVAYVKSEFLRHADPMIAQGQMKYMRNQFEFYGLKSPVSTGLSKEIFREKGLFDGEDLQSFVRLCMADEYREVNYCGLMMAERQIRKQPADFIYFLEELIRTRSWWDTVDWVNKLVGIHFRRYPDLILPVTKKWMDSGNFWLQRICMIFQLTYKEKTDFELMKKYILRVAGSDEFFLQKGAGWALRQYSKYNGPAVVEFIGKNPDLAPLTKREGMKWLKQNGRI